MKTWLITGCSSGIGRGIAKAVLKKGDQAVVTARDISKVKDLTDAYPNRALAVSLDVTRAESIQAAVKAAEDRFGMVDVLVNNAGYGYRSSIEEGEPENVDLLFQTNFFGPMELIKAVLPKMRAAKCGAIVNISSIGAIRSAVGSGYYAASKAALESASEALSMEVGPLGIKVMVVEPGAFRTNFYSTSLKGTSKKIDDYAETAGKTRKENIVDKQNQAGDPDRGGQVIVDVIDGDSYPFRLLLGTDAVARARSQMGRRLQEAEAWSSVSVQSDYEQDQQ